MAVEASLAARIKELEAENERLRERVSWADQWDFERLRSERDKLAAAARNILSCYKLVKLTDKGWPWEGPMFEALLRLRDALASIEEADDV